MWKAVLLVCFGAVVARGVIKGGWSEWSTDVDDGRVVTAAHFAVGAIDQQVDNDYHVKLVEIHRVKKQVVAGMNYKIEFTIGKTNCKKSEVGYENIDDCDLLEHDNHRSRCQAVVYRNLKNEHSLTSSACSSD